MCKGGAHGDATVERGRSAAALTASKDERARRGDGGGGRAWGDVRSSLCDRSRSAPLVRSRWILERWIPIRSPGEISVDPGAVDPDPLPW